MNVVALPGRRAETEAWLKSLLEAAEYPDAKLTRVAEIPGSDHLYLDIVALADIVRRWQEQHLGLQS